MRQVGSNPGLRHDLPCCDGICMAIGVISQLVLKSLALPDLPWWHPNPCVIWDNSIASGIHI